VLLLLAAPVMLLRVSVAVGPVCSPVDLAAGRGGAAVAAAAAASN
jgi:hypothetical protein